MTLRIPHGSLLLALDDEDLSPEDLEELKKFRVDGLKLVGCFLYDTEFNEWNRYMYVIEYGDRRYGRLFRVACGKHADYHEFLSETDLNRLWDFEPVFSAMREQTIFV